MKNNTIGFIGAGNMAAAMIGGIANNNGDAKHVRVFAPSTKNTIKLREQFGVVISKSAEELIAECDIIILAVKPQIMQSVLHSLQCTFDEKRASQPLIISVAAGIPCSHIEKWLDNNFAIVRVMPNTPSLVGAGASGMFANSQVSTEQKQAAETVINTTGISTWLNDEAEIDAVTALSGSGPAYFMLFVKSLIESGINAGLSEDTAKALAIQTCEGSAQLIRNSDVSIEQLIKNVTSPGGTTEQALKSFTTNELPSIVDSAYNAALKRAKELADELQ